MARDENIPLGIRIAAAAIARQNNLTPQQYRELCQRLLRQTVQSQTHDLDRFWGDSAAQTEQNFRRAGVGEPYRNPSQLRPGDLVYGAGASRYGHAMVVGPRGQLVDQVGQGGPMSASFRQPRWIVHPESIAPHVGGTTGARSTSNVSRPQPGPVPPPSETPVPFSRNPNSYTTLINAGVPTSKIQEAINSGLNPNQLPPEYFGLPADAYTPSVPVSSDAAAAPLPAETPSILPTPIPGAEEGASVIPGGSVETTPPPTISDLTFSLPSPDPSASPEGGSQFQPSDFQSAGETPPYLDSATQPAGGIDLPMVYGDNWSAAPEGSYSNATQQYWTTYNQGLADNPNGNFSIQYDAQGNPSVVPYVDATPAANVGGSDIAGFAQGTSYLGADLPSNQDALSTAATQQYWSAWDQGVSQFGDNNFSLQYDAQGNPYVVPYISDQSTFPLDTAQAVEPGVGQGEAVQPQPESSQVDPYTPFTDFGDAWVGSQAAINDYWTATTQLGTYGTDWGYDPQGNPTTQGYGTQPNSQATQNTTTLPGIIAVGSQQPARANAGESFALGGGSSYGYNRPATGPGSYQGLGSFETFPGSGVYVTRGTAMDASGGSGQGTSTVGMRGMEGITAGPLPDTAAIYETDYGAINRAWQNVTTPPWGPEGPLFSQPQRLGKQPIEGFNYNPYSSIQFTPNRQQAQAPG